MIAKKNALILLSLITLLGAYFRGINLNWDSGMGYHPDELNIALAVKEVKFPDHFDPKFYAYGTVPIYTIRIISQGFEYITGNQQWTSETGYITYVGRVLSFCAATLTVPSLYFLARIIFSPELSLLAAFIAATTPLLIQYAHFSVTESAIILYAVGVAYTSLAWYKKHRIGTVLITGVLLGFSIATKISTVTYAIFPLIAFYNGHYKKNHLRRSFKQFLYSSVYLSLTILSVYIIVSSVTFIYPFETLDSLLYEQSVALGKTAVFYTNQFIDTKTYMFQLSQFPTTIGYPMTILAIIGLIIVAFETLKKRQAIHIILFLWLYMYLGIIGGWYAKFIRYVLPAYPFLILIGVYALQTLLACLRSIRITYLFVAVLVVVQLLQSFAFISIYIHPQTRQQALAWIETETPEHAIFLTDDATEFLSETSVEEYSGQGRFVKPRPHFGLESDEEMNTLSQWLATSDYYVIGTRRQLGVVERHQTVFPKTSHFYDLLFSGSIGYQLVASFSSYPSLNFFGNTIQFSDDFAEETVQVFDHPTIMIFKNNHTYDSEIILDKLQEI